MKRLFWRRWRFLAGVAAVAAILAEISGWMMETALPSYGRLLRGASLRFQSTVNPARYSPTMQVSVMSNEPTLLLDATCISGIWLQVIIPVISAALSELTARTRVQHGQAQLLAIAVAIPIGYHLFMHDLSFSLLVLPIIVTLDKAIWSESGKAWREKLPLRLVALAFVTPLLFSYAPSHFWIASISWLAFPVSQCLFLGSAGGRFAKPCFS